jgi:hypothetical protein
MYELDGNGKYSNIGDFDATPRLSRSVPLPSAGGKVDGNTMDSGDDMWDETPPELLPSVFSSRKKNQMRKRAPTGNPTCHGRCWAWVFIRCHPQQEAGANPSEAGGRVAGGLANTGGLFAAASFSYKT